METLQNLLKKLHSTLHKDEVLKSQVIAVLIEVAGVTLSPSQVTLKEGVIYIEASPVVQSEIKLNEERVVKTLREKDLVVNRFLYK